MHHRADSGTEHSCPTVKCKIKNEKSFIISFARFFNIEGFRWPSFFNGHLVMIPRNVNYQKVQNTVVKFYQDPAIISGCCSSWSVLWLHFFIFIYVFVYQEKTNNDQASLQAKVEFKIFKKMRSLVWLYYGLIAKAQSLNQVTKKLPKTYNL